MTHIKKVSVQKALADDGTCNEIKDVIDDQSLTCIFDMISAKGLTG